jgi:hypothetical protein
MVLPALYLYTRPFVSSPVSPTWDDINYLTKLGPALSLTPTGNNLPIDLVSAYAIIMTKSWNNSLIRD